MLDVTCYNNIHITSIQTAPPLIMSKQSLHNTAKQHSGISYEDSIKALTLNPSLYHRIGQEEGCKRLSTLFYDRVFNDNDAQWFLNIFSSSTKSEAIDNQVRKMMMNVVNLESCKS